MGCTHHINELRQLQLDPDGQGIRGVDHRPDQLVVVGQEVIVQSLRVGVSRVENGPCGQRTDEQHEHLEEHQQGSLQT